MRQVGRAQPAQAHVHPAGGACVFSWARRALAVGLIGAGLSLVTWRPTAVTQDLGLTCTAEANGKKCACPVMPGETVMIPCSSQLDPTSCGVCSVMTADRKRDGRSCITVQ